MPNETTLIIRNRTEKDRLIKDAIFAFSGGRKSILIKGEGEEISTAVEVAEILKHRLYPNIEISNVFLGSRPYYNRRQGFNRRQKGYDNPRKKDLISKIEITLKTKTF